MKMSIFLEGIKVNKRNIICFASIFFSLFTWYYIYSFDLLRLFVENKMINFLFYNSLFNFIISLFLILNSLFFHKFKISNIYTWSIFSIIGTILILFPIQFYFRLIIFLILGVGFSISILSFFIYFWQLTLPQERGRIAGLISFILLPIFSLTVITVKSLSFFVVDLLCVFLNLLIILIKILMLDEENLLFVKNDNNLIGYNPENKIIVLYTIPWLFYSLINTTLAKTVSFHISKYFPVYLLTILMLIQIIGGSLGSLLGGIISDFFGRRISLAIGLTIYGITSAICGLTKNYMIFTVIFLGNGITWGIFLTLYSFLIWGDLATKNTCAYRYSVGLLIFYLSQGIGSLFSNYLLKIPLVIASIIICLLIFLSNIPLIFAPELLPSVFREKIRYKLYLFMIKRKK